MDARSLKPLGTLKVRYADGPQDCEAIAVVPGEDRVLLLNKDARQSVAYSVVFDPSAQETKVAQRFAVLSRRANATGNVMAFLKAGVLGERLTGFDVAPGGRMAAALTYTDVRIFRREEKQTWQEVLQQAPEVIALPRIYQPEALCFDGKGRYLYVTSEETPTPLIRRRMAP